MKEGEKQRKFHEALLKMLYPPPSPSPVSDKDDDEEKEVTEATSIELLNDLPGEEVEIEEPSPSSGDDNDGGDGKLTRAQRKRLRKRKLKEAASRRRKIIGPLFLGADDDIDRSHGSVSDAGNVAEGVRRNAATGIEVVSNAPEGVRQNAETDVSGEEAASSALCSNKNKLKQRRK